MAIAHDISERKEAENKIRLSEARYKNLFEASPLGIILEDLDGTIISANAAFCREYGYEPIELIGKNIRLLANPENKTLVQKNIEQIIQHGKLNSQIKATTKKGQIIDLELIESLIDLPDGRKGILSICKNITEQIAAEQAKKESEQKTSAIIHAIPDLIFIINKAGIFTEYFASSDQDLLMLPQDFAGQPVEAVLPPFLAASTKEHLNKVLETQSPSAFEYELSIRQKTNYFEARMVPLGDQQALTLVRNITEKKQTEKAIKQQNTFISTLLDSIPNPLFYMDKDSVYLGVNKAFTEFFNVKREDIVGKNMFDWDDHTVALKNHIDDLRIFEGREAVQMHERTITLMNGEQRNVLLNKSAFHTSEGEVAGLIGLIIDISDRKKNELELLAAKEKAEESDRLKTSFLQNMNHEIRTPLNAILGFSDLLFEDVPDEQKREFVNIININAEQLLHIIDEVLIISRMDAERISVEKQAFALDALMQDLKLTFTNPCIDKNLDLIVNKPENADYQIYTDKAKLRQVLSGLIDNAVKYTTKGSISLGYTVDGRDLRINVTDTGIGIPHEEQHRIFDRFFRGERPQRLAIRGNGLGLSIVSSMVNLLNGHIEVQSEPGQGSTFTLFLPGAVILDSQNDASDSELLTELPRQSQLTFLIAEDEDDNFEYLSALAINHAATVLRARNGKEAIRLLEANHIDIVLIDIKMPVMDGLEATRIIRATYPKLPIVIQTAYSQPDEVRMAIEAGANDVLIKPIKKEVFYQVIQRLLG
ncbi:MAG TPA: PAS domain S-box protein [Bacteroidales bacterium]|nr:PAS domain S-box protein [Bacteroidales bacterium]